MNDTVAGQPLLVVYQPEVATALIFKREVDGQEWTFTAEGGESSQFVLTDAETGSRWTALSGGALDGPLDGSTLERVPATTSFWFGWKDFYPDTYVYGVSAPE